MQTRKSPWLYTHLQVQKTCSASDLPCVPVRTCTPPIFTVDATKSDEELSSVGNFRRPRRLATGCKRCMWTRTCPWRRACSCSCLVAASCCSTFNLINRNRSSLPGHHRKGPRRTSSVGWSRFRPHRGPPASSMTVVGELFGLTPIFSIQGKEHCWETIFPMPFHHRFSLN